MALAKLTNGCLAEIMGGFEFDKPIVQVLGSKNLPGTGGSTRYRLLVSDGETLISYAMLASQLNNYANENILTEYTIICIEKYIMSLASRGKKVMIILDLTVLHPGSDVKMKIGNPVHFDFLKVQENVPITNDSISVEEPLRSNGFKSTGCSSGATTSNEGVITPRVDSNHAGSSEANVQENTLPVSNDLGLINPVSNNPSQSTPNSSATNVPCPITSLSPYQNKWMIKARVTSKTNVKTWKNDRGEGKLFNMDLMDESGEIRATGFNNAVDKFYDMIQVGKVYLISKCVLKSANKKFTTINNDYEMTFTFDTVVEECQDADNAIPNVTYNFVPLSQISNKKADENVDVAGICRDVGDVIEFVARTSGRLLKKREITLVDSSLHSVSLTLWGKDALDFATDSQPVIVIKSGKISEYGGGKSISMVQGSSMNINPDIQEAHRLRGWYDSEGSGKNYTPLSKTVSVAPASPDWMNFYETKEKNIGSSDKPDYFQCKAIIYTIKSSSCVYKSCAKSDCYKKVVDQDDGTYKCDKCHSISSDFKYRLLLNALIVDWTSNRWVNIFSDQGENLLGASSHEVGRAFDENKDRLEAILSKAHFKGCIFKFRAKLENFNDCNRVKINVMSILPINHKEYNSYLVANIKAMTATAQNKN